MSLGSTLREARERKGLTIAQVAEQTRMIHQLVEEIEQDDFHRISAPIYGRGFIKLFAECVDEDPAPLMQEFTEIYTGLRRPGVRTRPVQTPVESSEVAEPKDRNAPPPRPKVRAVVVADEPEEHPAAPAADAPEARPSGRFVETSLPAAAEPVESPKSEVESPADSGRDAPTARPTSDGVPAIATQETSTPGSAGILPAADGVPAVATQGEGADAAPPADDETLLGELFDLVARKRLQRSEESSSTMHDDKDESPVKISLPKPAPSWDDAPLEEDGDFWQKLYNLHKWKYWKVGAALAGLCLLAVIVFGLVANRHSKPEGADSNASQTTAFSEPQPEPASPTPPRTRTPTPTPTRTRTLNSNSQLSTPSAGDAAASPADGRTVYTANLIPPPDSYVD